MFIIQRLKHCENPSQFTRTTDLNEVELAPARLREACCSESENIYGKIQPDVASDRCDRDAGMQLINHELFGSAVKDYTALGLSIKKNY